MVFMVFGWFPWFVKVVSWFFVGLHGFEGSFMFFHVFWLVSMVFGWFFMVFDWFSWFFKVVSWFFMVFG